MVKNEPIPPNLTIPDLLASRARQQPDDLAYTFVDYETDPAGISDSLTWSELSQRAQVVAEKLARCGAPGDRVAILAPQGLDYLIGFFGAVAAGFIAVPLPMPALSQHDQRVVGVMRDSTPVAILTTSGVVDEIRKYGQLDKRQRPPKFIEVDTLDFDSPAKPAPRAALPKTAYLQYTSGSTRQPAGVVVSHRNVLANLDQLLTDYYEACPDGPPADTTVVSWAPFYHDMGLMFGLFIALVLGRPAVLMSPVAFMQKPARWMRQLACHTSVFSVAPNFAFDLAVKRTTDEDLAGMDLRAVVVLANGAERVRGSTVRRFHERFAAFGLSDSALRPSYGLAEATVYVVSSPGGRRPTAVWFDREKLAAGHAERCEDESGAELIGCGTPRSTTVRVVDPENCIESPPGTIGEIWVHGDQVAAGYWHNQKLTERLFAAQLSAPTTGTPTGPWLRTGDLGVMFEGELFIIGRIKDLLIVDGRNHYPDDIEATIAEFTGGRVAAISVPDDTSEKLVVIAELKNHDESALESLNRQATSAISMAHNVRLSDFVLVPPRSLPLTTSGKLRRASCVELYRSGDFSRLDGSG